MLERARRAPVNTRIRTALLPLLALLAIAMLLPPVASATTYSKTARCDGVAVRTRPAVTATRKRLIDVGTRIAVTASLVDGGHWSVRCGGSRHGHTWYRITAINGRSVRSLYGVAYLYAARGTLRGASETRYAACDGISLRTSPRTDATRKATIDLGARASVTGTLTNRGGWTTRCGGATRSGDSWYRIVAIDGTSVRSRYGVDYLYAATSLLAATSPQPAAAESSPGSTPAPSPTAAPPSSPAATPTPTTTPTSAPPTAAPTPTPTPKPTATPSAAPTATPTPAPTLPPTTAGTNLEGIDVSHWQNAIDWTKVAAAGKTFAFLKASESTTYVDPTYQANRAAAKANGIVVGAYHFARPDAGANDAVNEADHFVDTAAPVAGELVPVLDLEVNGGLDKATLQAWVRAFLDHVYDRTGQRGIIYVSPSFWQNSMGNVTTFASGGYKVLWIAHWTTASSPSVPASNWGGNGWTFWQYTSSGVVPGIGGAVDLDRFNGTDLAKVLVH